MSQFLVGLTGGIGSGKSTVAQLFAEYGIVVVDADQVARAVVAPGEPALAEIVRHFGNDILNADGELNRALLRQRIFSDDADKHWLNALLHPLIRARMQQQLTAASSPYAILMAPLLLENQLDQRVDQVLVVDISEQLQISRTMARDQNDPALVQAIMASQCSRQQRLSKASQIVDNHGSPADLPAQVAALHQLYLQLAKEKLANAAT